MIAFAHSLYSAMWSNIWAPPGWTLLGLVVSHRAHRKRADAQHEELKQHVTDSLERPR